jgi:glycosyltransferase involved in cell wall biosynthesis
VKVAHVPYTFAPDPVGGTEIYVESLCHELRAHEIDSFIAAPSNKGAEEAYEHNGLRVYRFRPAPQSKRMLQELYGDGDPQSAAAFAKILDEERPDAIHMHAFTRATSVLLVRAAKQRALPVFFTYHTPTVSCQRGDLSFRNKDICDGRLDVQRCTSCYAESLGVPRWASDLLSYVPFPLARAVGRANSSEMCLALQLSELVRKRQAAFQQLMRDVDGVVAVSDWVRTLLLRNGVPNWKIVSSRHGLSRFQDNREPRVDPKRASLRVCFLGRIDGRKGSATLVNAMKLIPGVHIELHLYGITQGSDNQNVWDALKNSHGDARISFFDPVPHDMVVSMLRTYHVVAVPSQYVETGPLVVLESLAAGTPVIGSNLGGIAEWIQHEGNGLLVDSKDVQGWADALRRCAEDRRFLESLQQGIKFGRSMQDVAGEMAQLYLNHVKSREDCKMSRVRA